MIFKKTPLSTLKYIYENKLDCLYVDLSIALKILLIQPVTVASEERSFSRLMPIKLIKLICAQKILKSVLLVYR